MNCQSIPQEQMLEEIEKTLLLNTSFPNTVYKSSKYKKLLSTLKSSLLFSKKLELTYYPDLNDIIHNKGITINYHQHTKAVINQYLYGTTWHDSRIHASWFKEFKIYRQTYRHDRQTGDHNHKIK